MTDSAFPTHIATSSSGDTADAWLHPCGSPWQSEAPECVHDNPWFAADVYAGVAPTGAEATYYALRYKNAATGVIPLHEDGTITLVGQWRFPFGTYSWELPEGGAPLPEPAIDGARRELREEAGLSAARLDLILTLQLSNASSDETAYIYLATGLGAAEVERDPTEALSLARVPFRRALHAAVEGRVKDSLTVAGLLRLYHMAAEGELEADLAHLLLGR
ncbi:NUDIX hydrolase [Caulobacter sp. S45]|uniref:NUDIX domain-containing protein n=1 Tax=Caulobacter sp. S45 TaxID=1641861 RepID=UPI0015754C40|nr:NUDIX hydrolase [Caulobacter sp. S45]